ncbi:MAG: hypothetical protein ACRCYO_01175 [Bacteroidia bacterium]
MKLKIVTALFFSAFLIVILQTACKHDTVLPERQISFTDEIYPIIQANCQHSGCHGTVNTTQFELITYDDIVSKVKAGNADDSKLYEVITDVGGNIMPRSPYPALTDRNTLLIKLWILQGAKNN